MTMIHKQILRIDILLLQCNFQGAFRSLQGIKLVLHNEIFNQLKEIVLI